MIATFLSLNLLLRIARYKVRIARYKLTIACYKVRIVRLSKYCEI